MMRSNSLRSSSLLIICGFLVTVSQFGCDSGITESETKARDALREMGAIIVNDADGEHPATIMLMSEKIEKDLDGAVTNVGELTHLTHLEMTDLNVTDEHLKTVAGLKKINSLVLSGTQITDAGLKTISGLTQIDTLYVDKTSISPASVDIVAGFKKLKILDMSGCDVLSNLAPLTKLEDLEWLILDNSTLDSSAVDVIGGLPKLGRLTINGSTIADADLERLKSAKPNLSIDQSAEPDAAAAEVEEPIN